jgi:hypothetical protein
MNLEVTEARNDCAGEGQQQFNRSTGRWKVSVTIVLLFLTCNSVKIGIVGGGVQLGPFGTRPPIGLLCQPLAFMMMEKLVK